MRKEKIESEGGRRDEVTLVEEYLSTQTHMHARMHAHTRTYGTFDFLSWH